MFTVSRYLVCSSGKSAYASTAVSLIAHHIETTNINTGHFIMYSRITKIYDKKIIGHIFTNIFLWGYVKDWVFIPPLPCDLDDLEAWIIAAVKNIDVPMLMRVRQETECAMSPVVHTLNISSCQKETFSVFLWL
jgi:hypothetical protein